MFTIKDISFNVLKYVFLISSGGVVRFSFFFVSS